MCRNIYIYLYIYIYIYIILVDRYVIRPAKVTTYTLTKILPHERLNCLTRATHSKVYIFSPSLCNNNMNRRESQRKYYLFPILQYIKWYYICSPFWRKDSLTRKQTVNLTPSRVFIRLLKGGKLCIKFFGVTLLSPTSTSHLIS